MKRLLPAATSLEAMMAMIGISLVILASMGAKTAAFKAYQFAVSRERALLFAVETLEQLEALKRTRMLQNYQSSWGKFLGQLSAGSYVFSNSGLQDMGLLTSDAFAEKVYASEDRHDFFTRLERRIFIEIPETSAGEPDRRLVTVSVYFGLPENYSPQSFEQVSLQRLFVDTRGPAFAM